MTKLYYTSFLLLLVVAVNAQDHLANYKEIFIKEHTLLSAARLDLDYATLEYRKAKKDRSPDFMLSAYYSLQHGGRAFEIPTGTLLNPVYNNLSYLNAFNYPDDPVNYPEKYQEINNESINFLRRKEYDTNLTTTIPILNFATREKIKYKKLEEDLARLKYQQLEVKEWSNFKINYFSYFKRSELIKLLTVRKKGITAFYKQLESQNKNNKIVENRLKKVELDQFEIDIKIKEQKAALENDRTFLLTALNKNNTESIAIDEVDLADYQLNYTKEEVLKIWQDNSANIKLVNQRSKILEKAVSLSKQAYKPTLNLMLRGGLQGEDFDINEKPLYLIASLQLNWKLFNPKRKIENKQIEIITQKNTIENKNIEDNASHHIQAVYDKIQLEKDRLNYIAKNIEYNKLELFEVERKHEEGKVTYYDVYNVSLEIETAEIDYIQSRFDYLLLICELEKLIGTAIF